MGLLSAILGSLVATAAMAQIVPHRTVAPFFPTGNSTKPAPAPTDSTCVADCRVRYPELQAISWVPEPQIVFTTEVTVGTVTVYTTIYRGTTSPPRTHTVFNVDVPTEYSLWMLRSDGAGTAYLEVPLTISGRHTLKTLTYPTPWLDYPSEYHWEGVVPTTGKNAEPVCATATELDVAVLSPHPTYPQPTIKPDEADPSGASHKPLWVPVQDEPDKKWFDATFPSVSAFASCKSVAGKPAPTEFSAPKFIFETTSSTVFPTAITSKIPIIEISETGFEDTRFTKSTKRTTRTTRHEELTDSVFEPPTTSGPDYTKQTGPRFMSSETGFEVPDAHQTAPPPENTRPSNTQLPDVIISISNSNRPLVTAAPGLAKTTPVFTLVPTVVNGKPYASPAFVVPGSSALASIGASVTINGEPTVLTAPATVYTTVPSIINDVRTSVPVYIVSGSITATVGQTITINGQTTVLPAPDALFTSITTTIEGKETVMPAYIISGSITATMGQTVTIDGTTTVLSMPTTTHAVDTGFGRPVATTFGSSPRETGTSKGIVIWHFSFAWWEALLLSLGGLFLRL